jgi:hypothetical protein
MVVSFNKVVVALMCIVKDKEFKKEIVKKVSQGLKLVGSRG